MTHNAEKLYYEYLAKLTLETFMPNDYFKLIISDKPDLRMGNDHGIEVTRAISKEYGQAAGVFSHIQMKPRNQVDPRYIQTMEKNNFKLLEFKGVIGGFTPKEATIINSEPLKRAFVNKVTKALNYQIQVIDLFIYSPIYDWFEENTIREFMEWTNHNSGSTFSKIIVFEVPFVYTYATMNCYFEKTQINEELFRELINQSYQYALNAN